MKLLHTRKIKLSKNNINQELEILFSFIKTIEDIKEMTKRLKIHYDILSDSNLKFVQSLKLSIP